MNNVAKISQVSNSVKSMPAVVHMGVPVVTTEMLAGVYGTEVNNIQVNFSRNKDRFIEGKHFHKLTGSILKEFKNWLTQSKLVYKGVSIISKHAKSLILWTERGAARHAKMLDTDQAWDVFEALEDFYFCKKEEAEKKPNFRQSTAKELIPLRQTAERLIAHGVGNIYPDIWKHVHAEFGVQHINELLPEQIPLAISYLDALEGEYIPKQEALPVPKLDINYPLSWYPDNHPFMKNCYCRDGKMQLNRKVLVETQSPVKCILAKLAQHGYDVSSAVFEIDTLRHIVSETHWALHEIEKIAAVRDNANLTINI